MLVSMTAYGYGEAANEQIRLQVEIKSVNHRFCDVQMRIPREYLALEPRVANMVREHYNRGRVDVFVRREDLKGTGARPRVNMENARAYYQQLVDLKEALQLTGSIEVSMLLGLPGVAESIEPTRDAEDDWPLVKKAVEKALRAASEMRRQEGQALLRDLQTRFGTLKTLHREMGELAVGLEQELQARLETRVREVLDRARAGELDQGRLLQEVVYLVDRTDISEELTRVNSHLLQFELLLGESQPVGRKIEFLLQELQREANTIGSKTTNPAVSQRAVAMKVELEKIREQIQNIE
jgi:uncharacterized protein (TIGR00255 family)